MLTTEIEMILADLCQTHWGKFYSAAEVWKHLTYGWFICFILIVPQNNKHVGLKSSICNDLKTMYHQTVYTKNNYIECFVPSCFEVGEDIDLIAIVKVFYIYLIQSLIT